MFGEVSYRSGSCPGVVGRRWSLSAGSGSCGPLGSHGVRAGRWWSGSLHSGGRGVAVSGRTGPTAWAGRYHPRRNSLGCEG